MPWPLSAANSGPRRLSQAHGITETCRNSQPTCSAASCSSPADRPDVQSQAKTIQSLVGVWYAQTFQLARTKAATLDEHFAIATAIQAHDEQTAREAMRQHIVRAGERLHRIVDRSK